MAGRPINLRQARKRKAKVTAAKQAESNRILHGLKASDRKAATRAQEKQKKLLEGHKRDRTDKGPSA